jgi:hypothetical protein
MKKLLMIAMMITGVVGCAGSQLKNEWKGQRGYADSDVDAIMDQYKEYNQMKIKADLASNHFNTAPQDAAQSRLKNIFCSCVKKMGDSCRTKDGASKDHALWIKANAVDMAMKGNSMSFETNSMSVIDPAECM